jgi:hypothetical protein
VGNMTIPGGIGTGATPVIKNNTGIVGTTEEENAPNIGVTTNPEKLPPPELIVHDPTSLLTELPTRLTIRAYPVDAYDHNGLWPLLNKLPPTGGATLRPTCRS